MDSFLYSRRTSFRLLAGGLLSSALRPSVAAVRDASLEHIPALLPRDSTGHHFVLYSDCCSGIAGTDFARNFQLVNSVVSRIQPPPEFIAFPGDAISGYVPDPTELRRQWDYWQNEEMAWIHSAGVPLHQSTSNHNTYDANSEQVFREVHSHLPQNGPESQRGLAYYARRGNLLYVSTHQPDRQQLIDYRWLKRVLEEHADCPYKFVAGHYPVFPVNGYLAWPMWCFPPEQREPFWELLGKHNVTAYLTSHIIAFDVQVHDGVLQILSGGAGTNYGPGGFMPGTSEYLHAVQIAVDRRGTRFQVRDTRGCVREKLSWPLELSPVEVWQEVAPAKATEMLSTVDWSKEIVALRVAGAPRQNDASRGDETILCAVDSSEGVEPVWIGIDESDRLLIRLVSRSGYGWQVWHGPALARAKTFDFQIAFHPDMGPGGVLYRDQETAAWTSLASTSSKGVENLRPMARWAVGHAQSGPEDRAFRGSSLQLYWTHRALPAL